MSVVTVINILMLLYLIVLMTQHYCGEDIGGGSSLDMERFLQTRPLVYNDNQSDSRKGQQVEVRC